MRPPLQPLKGLAPAIQGPPCLPEFLHSCGSRDANQSFQTSVEPRRPQGHLGAEASTLPSCPGPAWALPTSPAIFLNSSLAQPVTSLGHASRPLLMKFPLLGMSSPTPWDTYSSFKTQVSVSISASHSCARQTHSPQIQ